MSIDAKPTFVEEFESVTNRRYGDAQLLAARILFNLHLDHNEKLIELFSKIDNPLRARNLGRQLERQRK